MLLWKNRMSAPIHRAFVFAALPLIALNSWACSRDPHKLKQSYLASGDQYVAKRELGEAIVQYRRALAVDPNFGEARLKLGDAYVQTGDTRNALREFVRAADLLPNNVTAQLRAGSVC
jgi:cytochrome c-type biogenesis protein CcmH/NrfG